MQTLAREGHMTILRSNIALFMIGLSIFLFLLAGILNDSEMLDVSELAFTENFLAIFSVLFMVVGIYLAFSNKHMLRKIHRRRHYFETTPSRSSRRGA